MSLKEDTLHHLKACDRARNKASWNYHYAIYTRQMKENKLVSLSDKKKLWAKLIRIYGDK